MLVLKPKLFAPSNTKAVDNHGSTSSRTEELLCSSTALTPCCLTTPSSSEKTDAKSKRPFCCVWGGDQRDYTFMETDGTVYTTVLMHIWFVFE